MRRRVAALPARPQHSEDDRRGRLCAHEAGRHLRQHGKGGIHDEHALAQALASGQVAGAGLDVRDQEPPPLDHPLLRFPTVVATYHTAGVTTEARRNMASISAEQIVSLLGGSRPPRLVNPEVWPVYATRFARILGRPVASVEPPHPQPQEPAQPAISPARRCPDEPRRFLKTTAPLALACLALVHGSASAAYPDRPIKMIVAYSAGGATDVTARAIAPFIEKYLGGGARIVIENRTGAGGAIGFTAIASAPPDGYTIGFVNTPNLLTIPIERKSSFTWEYFDLIGNVVDDPSNFSVPSSSPITTDQLAAYARSKPGQVTVGTTGLSLTIISPC